MLLNFLIAEKKTFTGMVVNGGEGGICERFCPLLALISNYPHSYYSDYSPPLCHTDYIIAIMSPSLHRHHVRKQLCFYSVQFPADEDLQIEM